MPCAFKSPWHYAFLLLHLLQKMTQAKHGFLELVRLVRVNLMHRKDFTAAPSTTNSSTD